jgi:hypothetical protein
MLNGPLLLSLPVAESRPYVMYTLVVPRSRPKCYWYSSCRMVWLFRLHLLPPKVSFDSINYKLSEGVYTLGDRYMSAQPKVRNYGYHFHGKGIKLHLTEIYRCQWCFTRGTRLRQYLRYLRFPRWHGRKHLGVCHLFLRQRQSTWAVPKESYLQNASLEPKTFFFFDFKFFIRKKITALANVTTRM